ncbi:unnamed protein product [Bathycoccus prasinos]|jgi:hypothetical protein|tara:strand:- start:2063 stop:3076 length:1014 start_codon:yes stop_codon:yes gene_type:complete
MECLQNFREIRDEVEALKAIYNNNVLLGDEDKEVKEEEEEEKVVDIIREDFGTENGSLEKREIKIAVTFSPTNRMILTFDGNSYPSRKAFSIETIKTPDNFSWDFEKTVTEMKDDLYLSNKGEVFAFDFIQKYEEMFAREDALAKKREAKEKEENERYARERREKQKNTMSEEEAKTKEAIFNNDHLVSWKHEGDPNVTPLLETELADDVRKRFKSHEIVCYEKCRFQAHTLTNVQTIKEIKIALKLILLDKKVQTATHPRMFAYRIPNDDDFNDDGETGAGKNLANVLRLRGSESVFVCVTRWFGGSHLGPQRFKVINSCASEALEKVGAIGFQKK